MRGDVVANVLALGLLAAPAVFGWQAYHFFRDGHWTPLTLAGALERLDLAHPVLAGHPLRMFLELPAALWAFTGSVAILLAWEALRALARRRAKAV